MDAVALSNGDPGPSGLVAGWVARLATVTVALATWSWALLVWAAEPDAVSVPTQALTEALVQPADDACLSRDLAPSVATWLGRERVRAALTVEVRADPRTVGFVLRRDEEVRVERTLSPAPVDCADRRAALGLAIAMALDAAVLEALAPSVPEPEEVVPEEPEEVEPEPVGVVVPVEAAPTPAPEEIDQPEEPAERSLRLSLDVEGMPVFGVLPRVGFGGEIGVELGWTSWLDARVAAGGAGGLTATLAEGRVTAWLAYGAVELCPGRSFGRVRLRGCAGVGAGAMQARGRGFMQSRTVTQPWVAVRTGAELDVRVSPRVALRVGGRLLTPVVASRLDVRDPSDAVVDVQEPSPAGGQVGLGVVVRLIGPWS